jgi:nitroreductase
MPSAHQRGIRYVHMEAGHVAQNVDLQAVLLDLGTVVIGAFDDAGVKQVAYLREHDQPLYSSRLGENNYAGTLDSASK